MAFKQTGMFYCQLSTFFCRINPSNDKLFMTRSFKLHPSYKKVSSNSFDNDVAVVCLEKPAVLNDQVNVACMPTGSASEEMTNCYTTGI